MSDLSNNLAILSHLKDKVYKWKNISILLIAIIVILLFRTFFEESISPSIETGSYIAEIEIEGAIFENEYRSKILKKIKEDSSVKALIININSPGGSIVGSEILYGELKDIAKSKPIVAVMNSVAASGGYMVAIASDHIIAHNGTLTGSIGVLMQSAEMVDLAKKIGVNFKTYKSAPLKATPSPFERPNEIVDRVIQSSIKDSANFFFDLVKKERGERLKDSNHSIAFDGRVFTGRQALKIGLVDEIGNKNSAIVHLNKKYKINISDLKVKKVDLEKPQDALFKRLSGSLPFFGSENNSNNKIMAILPF